MLEEWGSVAVGSDRNKIYSELSSSKDVVCCGDSGVSLPVKNNLHLSNLLLRKQSLRRILARASKHAGIIASPQPRVLSLALAFSSRRGRRVH